MIKKAVLCIILCPAYLTHSADHIHEVTEKTLPLVSYTSHAEKSYHQESIESSYQDPLLERPLHTLLENNLAADTVSILARVTTLNPKACSKAIQYYHCTRPFVTYFFNDNHTLKSAEQSPGSDHIKHIKFFAFIQKSELLSKNSKFAYLFDNKDITQKPLLQTIMNKLKGANHEGSIKETLYQIAESLPDADSRKEAYYLTVFNPNSTIRQDTQFIGTVLHKLGQLYHNKNPQDPRIMSVFETAATPYKSIDACIDLGKLHEQKFKEHAHCIPHDKTWWVKSSYSEAMNAVSYCLEHQTSLGYLDLALRAYTEALNRGHTKAHYNLGLLYLGYENHRAVVSSERAQYIPCGSCESFYNACNKKVSQFDQDARMSFSALYLHTDMEKEAAEALKKLGQEHHIETLKKAKPNRIQRVPMWGNSK